MVNRPYQCPECSRVFKTESGRKWHLTHQHEINRAINMLDGEWESKLSGLKDENGFFKQKAEDFESRLNKSMLLLQSEQVAEMEARISELKSYTEVQQTREELRKLSMLTAVQGRLIEQRLGIPFNQTLEEFNKIMYPVTNTAKTDTSKSNEEG